jgi:hypothetical protein
MQGGHTGPPLQRVMFRLIEMCRGRPVCLPAIGTINPIDAGKPSGNNYDPKKNVGAIKFFTPTRVI